MTAHDKVLGYIRTGVPYAIGAFLSWILATTTLDLSGAPEVALIAFCVAAVTNLYYGVIRVVEVRFPLLGVFLGWPKAPQYAEVGNLWASLVRTCIPPIVGAVIVSGSAWIAQAFGVVIDAQAQAGSIVVAVAAVEAVYYAGARALLERFPGLAWLLGGDFRPSYPAVTVGD